MKSNETPAHEAKESPALERKEQRAQQQLGVRATDFQGPVRTKDAARAQRKVTRKMKRGTR